MIQLSAKPPRKLTSLLVEAVRSYLDLQEYSQQPNYIYSEYKDIERGYRWITHTIASGTERHYITMSEERLWKFRRPEWMNSSLARSAGVYGAGALVGYDSSYGCELWRWDL